MAVDQADTATAGSTSAPPPAKRKRTAVAEPPNPINGWRYIRGRIASKTTGKKPVHLKDPKGASYTRNGKETSWRCSSKSCPAVVRKLKGDTEYQLCNYHSCSKSHGPRDVPAIPAHIQNLLGGTQQALTEFVKSGSNANGTQQQGTV